MVKKFRKVKIGGKDFIVMTPTRQDRKAMRRFRKLMRKAQKEQ